MLNPLEILPIVIGQAFCSQTLARTPEPFSEMTDAESVEQFNHALESKLVIAYAGALELIHGCRRTLGGRAIDLCCGPGHFTLFLAKYLGYDEVIGVDISESMLEVARKNADEWGLSDRVKFIKRDVLNGELGVEQYDLVTCNDAAHHLTGDTPDSIAPVARLMERMTELTKPTGTTFLMDLVRLKNKDLTDRYTRAIGADYINNGWQRFYQDFCDSMLAAWTPSELQAAIPQSENRRWKHVVQRLLPTIQMVISAPADGERFRLRHDLPWQNDQIIPTKLSTEWKIFRAMMR
jgi:ubiquinone/menaquinone biosynthesis C-methylase UbiE